MSLNRYSMLIISAFMFLVQLGSPLQSFSQSSPEEDGLSWLLVQQNPDNGTWGQDSVRETAAVVELLQELEQTGPAYTDGIAYLEGVAPEVIDYRSRKISALAKAGINLSTDVDGLISLQNSDGGFGFKEGYPSSIIDSVLAARALAQTAFDDHEVIGRLLYYVTDNQDPDNGSFAFTPGGQGSIDVTALAVMALSDYLARYSGLAAYIQNALSALTAQQLPDGGFGEDASTVLQTALAVRALVAAGASSTTVLQARQYLVSAQQPEGSWDNDTYVTAQALRALHASAGVDKANLQIQGSSLTITPPHPVGGQTVTISCTVENNGIQTAENTSGEVAVAFYRGIHPDGQEIGRTVVAGIEPAGSTVVQITWVLDGIIGGEDIYVVADPEDEIEEAREEDNTTFYSFTASSEPDLSLSAVDIGFDNMAPLDGETFTMTAVIRNLGETDAGLVSVDVYAGDPAAGAEHLGGLILNEIAGGSYGTATFDTALSEGTYELYVAVDYENSIDESNENNNISLKSITVRPVEYEGIDLSVSAGSISFAPLYPTESDLLTISAVVHNSGDRDAHDVIVKIYDGEPPGGTLLAEDIFDTVMSGHEAAVNAAGTLTAGAHEIVVVVDPDDAIPEISTINNTARKTITVLSDVEVIDLAAHAIQFTPQDPEEGDVVDIRYGVINESSITVEHSKLRIYEGDPAAGGTLMVPEITIPQLGPGNSGWITIERDTTAWGGRHDIHVIVDPHDDIQEQDEANNRATAALVVTTQHTIDLKVTAASITTIPPGPAAGDMVTLECMVENTGSEAIPTAELAFYDDGLLIDTAALTDIPAYGSTTVQVTWDTAGLAGNRTISVAVDPSNGIDEINEFNNTAEKLILLGACDLSVSAENISFSPEAPLAGDSVRIQSAVHNHGSRASEGFTVIFYNGGTDNESLIQTVPVAGIAAGGSDNATIFWQAPASDASYRIYVKVDPAHEITEEDESNNLAQRVISVSTQADLEVRQTDMGVTPLSATLADEVTVRAIIRNRGGTDTADVEVSFYDNDPDNESTRIGDPEIITMISGGAAQTVEKSFFLTAGDHTIYVVADPGGTIPESDESNNRASISLSVEALQDLEVRSQDMEIGPAEPEVGDNLTITAAVRNLGQGQYSDVLVQFYDGSPDSGGEQIGTDQMISLSAGETVAVSAVYPDVSGGSHEIWVIVDPDNETDDENRGNNRADKQVIIYTQEPDVAVGQGQLSYSPLSPRAGETINLTARVTNHGETPADSVVVRFYAGDPRGSGYLIAEGNIGTIADRSTADAAAEVVLQPGSHEIFVEVDPYDTITESNENNNLSMTVLVTGGLEGFYDDCGNPAEDTHRVQGTDTVITGIDPANQPAAVTASTHPISVQYTYTGLAPNAPYQVVVNYLQEQGGQRVQSLSADNQSLHGPMTLPENLAEYISFDLPREIYLHDGAVTLSFDNESEQDVLVGEIFIVQKSGRRQEAVRKGVDWLISHQSDVGSWPPYNTIKNLAPAVRAFSKCGPAQYQEDYDLILARLKGLQATNNSWGGIGPTSETILALVEAGVPASDPAIQNAVNWLMDQQENGSWGNAKANGLVITSLIRAGIDPSHSAIQDGAQTLIDTQINNQYWSNEEGGSVISVWIGPYPVIALSLALSPDHPTVINARNYYRQKTLSGTYRYHPMILHNCLEILRHSGGSETDIIDMVDFLVDSQSDWTDGGWANSSQNIKPLSDPFATGRVLLSLCRARDEYSIPATIDVDTAIQDGLEYLVNTSKKNESRDIFTPYNSTEVTAKTAVTLHYSGYAYAQQHIREALERIIDCQCPTGYWQWHLIHPNTPGYQCSSNLPKIDAIAGAILALSESPLSIQGKQDAVAAGIQALFNNQNSGSRGTGWPRQAGSGYASKTLSTGKVLLGLLKSGVSPSDSHIVNGLDWLIDQQQPDGSFGGYQETFYALLAFEESGGYESEVSDAVEWIRDTQQADGGWENIANTAWALIALATLGDGATDIARDVAKGVNWLLAVQNSDGGWASAPGMTASNTNGTTLATWALVVADYEMDIELELIFSKPYYYPGDMVRMEVTRLDDGLPIETIEGTVTEAEGDVYTIGFSGSDAMFSGSHILSSNHPPGTDTVNIVATGDNGDSFGTQTGTIIVKSGEQELPDLVITEADIMFSADTPQQGQLITITAEVKNPELRDAVNVEVVCYDGYPEAGGVLIDNATLQRIAGLDGSTLAFTWQATSGMHEIYVVVDPDNTVAEANEQNNRAYKTIDVSASAYEADLSINSGDISVTPPDPAEGEIVIIEATVRNSGGSDAADVPVRFYDGTVQIGDNLTIPYITAGTQEDVRIAWDSLGQSGRNYIHVKADPDNNIAESNELNNNAMAVIDVGGIPDLPDFSVQPADISFDPASVQEGQTVTVSAAVHNRGQAAGGITVGFYNGDPGSGGTLIEEEIIYNTVFFGTSETVHTELETAGRAGSLDIHVVVDPDDMIDEDDEDNNRAAARLSVGDSDFILIVTLDNTDYEAGDDVLITVLLTNQRTEERVVTLDIPVEDAGDTMVGMPVTGEVLNIGGQSTVDFQTVWNVGNQRAGTYRMKAVIKENGSLQTTDTQEFIITADMALGARVIIEKSQYSSYEQVQILSEVKSYSTNYTFEDLMMGVQVKNMSGEVMDGSEFETAIDDLLPLETDQQTTIWNTGTYPPGIYKIVLEVTRNGSALVADNETFSIVESQATGTALQGAITAEPGSVHRGHQVQLDYTVQNIGNTVLDDATMHIQVVHTGSTEAVTEYTDTCYLELGAACNGTRMVETYLIEPGDCLALLSGVVGGVTQTIGMTPFSVLNRCPVAEAGPDELVLIGEQALLDGSESFDPDGDPLTYLWSLLERPIGSTTEIAGADQYNPLITADKHGDYVIQLVVNDGICDSESDMLLITTENRPPVAAAGEDQAVFVGNQVQLDGSGSFDPDNDSLEGYQWSLISRPDNSTAEISDSTAVQPMLTPDEQGDYIISLVVSDFEYQSTPDTVLVTTVNRPPVADAGPDRHVDVGDAVQLDGSASSDPDGDQITRYNWSILNMPEGSSAALSDPLVPDPIFTADRAGTYIIQLIVNDAIDDSEPDIVVITTRNRPPIVDIRAVSECYVGDTIQLDGSLSYDPDGDDIQSYSWLVTGAPDNSTAAPLDPNAPVTAITIDKAGIYTIELTVSDGTLSGTALHTITTINRAPVADAGDDQEVQVGETVQLDGSGSYDPDDDTITYSWLVISAPAGTGTEPFPADAEQPHMVIDLPGKYILELSVSDGFYSTTDIITITTINRAPVADAGPDADAFIGEVVVLDGSGSYDPDGDTLTYAWQLVSMPAGSTALLEEADTDNATFVMDMHGQYVIELTVTDGDLESLPDQVIISSVNRAPTAHAGDDIFEYVGSQVTLDASLSSDPDNDTLTYVWEFSAKPQSSQAVLTDPAVVDPSFSIDAAGTYELQLTVNDGMLSATDAMSVSTINRVPVAVAGDNIQVYRGDTVALDGTGSYDPDGDSLSYLWEITVPAGSTATVAEPTAAQTECTVDVHGEYLLSLTVTDGDLEASDSFVVTTINRAPSAVAQADPSNATVGEIVVLDGSGSSDPDGDLLSYFWELAAPAGSTAVIEDPQAANTTFTTDIEGHYQATLTVSDGLLQDNATVTITAETAQTNDYTCSEITVPEAPFAMKTDYADLPDREDDDDDSSDDDSSDDDSSDDENRDDCNAGYVDVYSWQEYLDYVANNYGSDGYDYSSLRIRADISMENGDLIFRSPCDIIVEDGIDLTAENGIVGLDGRTGVKNERLTVVAQKVALMSAEGNTRLGHYSRVTAEELYVSALKKAKIENNSVIEVNGPVTVISQGDAESSKAWIKEDVQVTAERLYLEGPGHVTISPHCSIDVSGSIWLVSSGDGNDSDAWLQEGVTVDAAALCLRCVKEASIGPHAVIQVVGEVSLIATGEGDSSKARIKKGCEVTAETLVISGRKAVLGKNTTATVVENFHMQGDNKCKLKGSYTAGSVSGNCLE